MARATHLISLFLAGCVATTLIGVVASLAPEFFNFAVLVAGVLIALWLLAWLLDDWLINFLQLERFSYYSILISSAAAAVIGGGIAIWINS